MRATVMPVAFVVCAAAACSSSAAPSTPRVAIAPPLRVACGAPPVSQPRMHPRGTVTLPLPGAPDGIATTSDGRTSFVAIQSGVPRIAVIANAAAGPRLLRTIAVPRFVSGMRVTPDGRYVLAAAGAGAIVLDARAARAGSGRAVLGALAAPTRIAGHGPGAAEVAAATDDRHAFVTLEGAGVVAVFDLRAALAGRPGYLGAVPVGSGALGLAAAPDGRTLYEVSESARVPAHPRGALNVIDVARAVSDPRRAVIATASAPCAPVRVAVSPRGDTVWVTARNADALLGYAAATLTAHPTRALASVTPVGAQPLGLAVVAGGARVLVADADLGARGGSRSGVSVVATSSRPHQVAWLPTGPLADAIAPAAGRRAHITVSSRRALVSVALRALP